MDILQLMDGLISSVQQQHVLARWNKGDYCSMELKWLYSWSCIYLPLASERGSVLEGARLHWCDSYYMGLIAVLTLAPRQTVVVLLKS